MSARALYFTAPRTVETRPVDVGPPEDGEVVVETRLSAVSAGTELLVYRDEAPADLPVDETIDALAGDFSYPLRYGYAAVGDVVAVGDGADPAWESRTVFAFHPHQTRFRADVGTLVPLPEDLPARRGALLPTAETATNLVLDARPRIGERVVVFGAGVVGLVTTRLLAAFPLARLVVVEPLAARREAAREVGADVAVEPGAVRDALRGDDGDAVDGDDGGDAPDPDEGAALDGDDEGTVLDFDDGEGATLDVDDEGTVLDASGEGAALDGGDEGDALDDERDALDDVGTALDGDEGATLDVDDDEGATLDVDDDEGATLDAGDDERDAHGDGPTADLAVELSGRPETLDDAIDAVGFDGRVVVGSWYGDKRAPVALGGRFHRDRIDLVSSQVSTLDPALRGRWSTDRRVETALGWLGRIDADALVTHRIPFGNAGEAYRLLDERPEEALQVLLEYD